MAYRRKVPPVENPFVRLHVERMIALRGVPKVDVKNLPQIGLSKPSPASTPSGSRIDAMAARAQCRKQQEFVAKKQRQRQERNSNAQQVT